MTDSATTPSTESADDSGGRHAGASGVATVHPLLRAADEVVGAVKAVAGVDPVFMATPDKQAALVALAQARDLVEALWMRVLAVSEDVALETGTRDVATWLAAHALADPGQTRSAERVAVALAQRWRLVEESLAGGAMSAAQARVVATCLDELATGLAEGELAEGQAAVCGERRAELLGLAERELVWLAAEHGPRELRRLGERILAVVAPHVEDERDRRALEAAEQRASAATSLRMRRRGDGSTDVFVRVPDHAAARLRTYLDAFTSPRITTTDGVTDPATGQRLPCHRLAGDAFVSLLETLDPDRLPLHGGDATTLVVTIDLTDLMNGLGEAMTGDGTRVTAGQARRLACTAGLVPAVLGGDSRPLDVGRRRRLFTPAQRVALTLRHRTCQAEGCEVPSTWCEAHHREPWATGGPTDLTNAMLLCSWHHHRIHDPGYHHQHLPDGSVRYARRT